MAGNSDAEVGWDWESVCRGPENLPDRDNALGVQRGDEEKTSSVWQSLDASLTGALGAPSYEDPKAKDWINDSLQAAIYRDPDDGVVGISLVCQSLWEDLAFLVGLADVPKGSGMSVLTADLSSLESNTMFPLQFRSTLIDAVRVLGEPVHGPCFAGPNLQNASFVENSGPLFGPDTVFSMWYIDGELVRFMIGSRRITNPREDSKKVFDHLIKLQTESLGPPTTVLEQQGVIDRKAVWRRDDISEIEVGIKTKNDLTYGYVIADDLTQRHRFQGEKVIGPQEGDTWCDHFPLLSTGD